MTLPRLLRKARNTSMQTRKMTYSKVNIQHTGSEGDTLDYCKFLKIAHKNGFKSVRFGELLEKARFCKPQDRGV